MRSRTRTCEQCGLLCRRKYCDVYCQNKYKYEQYINRWKQGLETGLRGKIAISNYLVRYIRNKYDNKCARCGWNERHPIDNAVLLEVEHIDGNWKNNKEDNLILLCPNCHSLTPTFRFRNRGFGRIVQSRVVG